jgi:SAM-dependent methyltransferase
MNDQQEQWNRTFAGTADLFGEEASEPARYAADLFQREGRMRLLELGGGQGRDTLYFAARGFSISVLDYSAEAVAAISAKICQSGLSERATVLRHDVREPLPFPDRTCDACFSHMLFCMALTTPELAFLSREMRRVLTPGGLAVYTVRHTGDAHYGKGVHHGDGLYELDGFIVHFFSREKVGELVAGFDILGVDAFTEGELPRRLFRVTMRRHDD